MGNASERMMLQGSLHNMVVEVLEADSFPHRSLTLKLIAKVWQSVKIVMGYKEITECAPIWNNRQLQELVLMEKINEWEESGIGQLAQLYEGSTLKTFVELRREYGIPTNLFYRYLQIRHALNAQFKTQVVKWSRAPLLQRLVESGTTKGVHFRLIRADKQQNY